MLPAWVATRTCSSRPGANHGFGETPSLCARRALSVSNASNSRSTTTKRLGFGAVTRNDNGDGCAGKGPRRDHGRARGEVGLHVDDVESARRPWRPTPSWWARSEAERRAAGAVVALCRSHLVDDRGHSVGAIKSQRDVLAQVADAARQPLPVPAPRWIAVTATGAVVRCDDWMAARMTEHRTLIEIAG